MIKKSSILVLIVISFITLFYACGIDKSYYEGNDIDLRFSVDTLSFDTVFTTVGSTTKYLKIYNDRDQRILIDKIRFSNEFSSFFRMNVDGIQAQKELTDITILPEDSIYVFVETTIDPDQDVSISPFIIENHLEVIIENQIDSTLIQAWGQNANYIPAGKQKGAISFVSCDFGEWVWDDPKPYVIYGSIIIDSCTWVLPAGTEVYVHGGIAINDLGIYNDGLVIIGSNGRIQAEGTAEAPVRFQTDRLEESFQDDLGQWSGIIISSGSIGNRLEHTEIFHSLVGVRADSASQLVIDKSEFGFISANAVLGIHSNVDIFNSLIHNTGSHGVQFIQGGNYRMTHCTVYNPSSQNFSVVLNNFRCSDPLCFEQIFISPANGSFRNCIFTGFNSDQISIGDITEEDGDMNFFFDHCIYSLDDILDESGTPEILDFSEACINVDYDVDSFFIDEELLDFHLDTMSIPIDKGKLFTGFELDKDDFTRDVLPDIGCYEFVD